jgi:hypothetical protein
MNVDLTTGVVRIAKPDGTTVGTGFVVHSDVATRGSVALIATCAHVVAGALGLLNGTPETSQAEVCLNLPLVAPGRILIARVIHWHVPRPGDGGEYPLPERFLAGRGTPPTVAKSGRSF